MGRTWFLPLIAVVTLVAVFMMAPIPQDLSYHQFSGDADQLGVANFWNVISNIPFLLIGVAGTFLCARSKQLFARRSWLVFFVGVALVSFGSTWYHLHPNNMTLVWDRLPMAVGFMGLFVALLSEYVDQRAQSFLLLPCLALGGAAVMIWALNDDLRLYIWVQFFPLLTIVILLVFYPGKYAQKHYIAGALGCYALAKALELGDDQIYDFSGNLIAGHPLKHLVAAGGVTLIYQMLKHRKLV